ncbi:MAG: hypothetical protein L0Z50_05800 [Verrucomicrobiales bacterium]|nr:hypothetical protein [Verrucomicrobiales bacterium]
MRPEEFTAGLRKRVASQIVPYVSFLQETYAPPHAKTPSVTAQAEKLVQDPATMLLQAGLVDDVVKAKANRIALAVFRSKELNSQLRDASQKLQDNLELMAILPRLVYAPESMTSQDVERALTMILENDEFLTGPIRALFQDPALRQALEIPADLTVDAYLTRVREAMRAARDVDEVLAASGLVGRQAVTAVWLAVALVVAAAAAAVVKTVVALDAWAAVWAVALKVLVFTVSGETAVSSNRFLATDHFSVRSRCVNELDFPVWVVIAGGNSFKRVCVPPRMSTELLGIAAVEAILIGGAGNSLRTLRTVQHGTKGQGAYILCADKNDPGEVRLTWDGEEPVAVGNDRQQSAETGGSAGWSDLAGGGSAGVNFDERFAMARVAALAPHGFDLSSLVADAADAEHFYRSILMAEYLERQWAGGSHV